MIVLLWLQLVMGTRYSSDSGLKQGACKSGALQQINVCPVYRSGSVTCHTLVWLFPQTQKTASESHQWSQAALCKQLKGCFDLQQTQVLSLLTAAV